MPDVIALRSFVPATDLEISMKFYTDIGFVVEPLGMSIASARLGPFSFLLQHFYAENFAGNYMMQLLVRDLDAWWSRIEPLDLAARYGVRPPAAPKLQPWGLRVAYVVDPSGVLWHFAEERPA
jgi:hypothetical protein